MPLSLNTGSFQRVHSRRKSFVQLNVTKIFYGSPSLHPVSVCGDRDGIVVNVETGKKLCFDWYECTYSIPGFSLEIKLRDCASFLLVRGRKCTPQFPLIFNFRGKSTSWSSDSLQLQLESMVAELYVWKMDIHSQNTARHWRRLQCLLLVLASNSAMGIQWRHCLKI